MKDLIKLLTRCEIFDLLINILHYNYVKNFLIKNNYEYYFDKSASKFLNPNWEEISSL